MSSQPALANLALLLLAASPWLESCIEPAEQWQHSETPAEVEPSLYLPDAAFADLCSSATQFVGAELDYTPFPDVASAVPGVAGTWLRCYDNDDSTHAGVQISPDGSWRDFIVDAGELVARSGFEHEGFVHALDGGVVNPDSPGLVHLDLRPYGLDYESLPRGGNKLGTWASERALVFQTNGGTAVYLRVALPVRDVAFGYADDERAGSAACLTGEQRIIPTLDESAAMLRGDFVRCRGSLRDEPDQLHFEASSVELRRADGGTIRVRPFEGNDANGELLSFTLPGEGLDWQFWFVVVSRRPQKLWIKQADDTDAVFSALP
jgi:hypothetical protein